MKIVVDGDTNFALQGAPEDVLSAVAAVDEWLRTRARTLMSVAIDGEPIFPSTLLEKLKGLPTSEVEVLEIGSAEIAQIIEDSIRETQSVLPELPSACRQLAQVFQGANPSEGYQPFQELANIWSHLKQRQAMIANALGIELQSLEIEGRPFSSAHEELNGFLEEAAEAIEAGDTVLLGDLLEYELAPRAEHEQEIMAQLLARVPGRTA